MMIISEFYNLLLLRGNLHGAIFCILITTACFSYEESLRNRIPMDAEYRTNKELFSDYYSENRTYLDKKYEVLNKKAEIYSNLPLVLGIIFLVAELLISTVTDKIRLGKFQNGFNVQVVKKKVINFLDGYIAIYAVGIAIALIAVPSYLAFSWIFN